MQRDPMPRLLPRAPAVPATDTCVSGNCPRPHSVRVHAQGTDCGGTTRSTIGAPPLRNNAAPIPVSATIGLSQLTWGMLNRRQRNVRTRAKARLESWVAGCPPSG